MKSMNYLSANFLQLLLIVIGLTVAIIAAVKLKAPVQAAASKSLNFLHDSIVSTPVMRDNPYADVFHEAAQAAIKDKTNPWIYLSENWEKAVQFKGVEPALLDFIQKQAGKTIPKNAVVILSVRDYKDPNSIVMEYRDPATDSVLVATGHDPEPALYATFAGKNDTSTFKLICANGLVRELGGTVTGFEQDYIIRPNEYFIGITGATTNQAVNFAEENNLPVRFILEGVVTSKTPDFSKAKVYKDFAKKKKGKFDVVLQPGDILRKQNGKWLYIRTSVAPVLSN